MKSMSKKYEPLRKYLQAGESDTLKLSFEEIKNILGFVAEWATSVYDTRSAESRNLHNRRSLPCGRTEKISKP
jgi:hypothetical protein